MQPQDVFRRTLSSKAGKELQQQSKLRRVLSTNNPSDAAQAREMVEAEKQRRPSVFKTDPLDSMHLYRPSASGSVVQRPASERQVETMRKSTEPEPPAAKDTKEAPTAP